MSQLGPEATAQSKIQNPKSKICTRHRYCQIHMGVGVTITCYHRGTELVEAACKAAFARFAELDEIMSDYRPASELMRLCSLPIEKDIPVSADLFRVLDFAQQVAELSDGAFDVTCGPLVRLWREARLTGVMPSSSEISEKRKSVGYRFLRLDESRQTVRFLRPGMLLDLGGIGKGYACDQALLTLRSNGVRRALVEAGGDIAMSEPPPDKGGWKVGVQYQDAPLALSNCAISASGSSEQYLQDGPRRYSHVLDPRTGMGLTHQIPVTVIASDALTADSLAKVCGVLGIERIGPILGRYRARAHGRGWSSATASHSTKPE